MTEDIDQLRTELLNVMAEAGRLALKFDPLSAAAFAPIPNTAPQQYVVAGTLPMIAKVLPTEVAAYLASQSQVAQQSIGHLEAYERVREEFELAVTLGKLFDTDSAMLNVDALLRAHLAGQSQATRAVPEGWKVGNLLTMSDSDYPGMGGMFAQVWQGDDLIARVYGDSADEVRTRAALVAGAAQEVTQQAAPEEPVTLMAGVEQHNSAFDKACGKFYSEHGRLPAPIEIFAIASVTPATQQAAKAETAEQANVLPPTLGTDSQLDPIMSVLSTGRIIELFEKEFGGQDLPVADNEIVAFALDIEDEVLKQLSARRFRAQGGNTNTESSDLAPTTSTVSAPTVQPHPEVTPMFLLNAALCIEGKGTAEKCEAIIEKLGRIAEELRTTSGKGEAA